MGQSDSASKKKKWIIVGVLLALLAIAGIVVGVVVGGGGEDPDVPPIPPSPIPDGYNPYHVDESSVIDDQYRKSGLIITDNAEPSSYELFARTGGKSKRFQRINGLGDTNTTNLTLGVNTAQVPVGANNMITNKVSFEFGQAEPSTVYMILQDAEIERWEPDGSYVGLKDADPSLKLDMSNFELNMNPFSFKIGSTYTGETLISTADQTCYIMDKFLQMDFELPSQNIFGLGERNREFKLSQGTWTMWANGQETPYDDGTGFKQTYGVHPFALVQASQKKDEFFGIWFRNTNGMSPIIQHKDDGKTVFRYITTGGKIHAYFFMQGNAKQIIARYLNVIGKPQLPPLWSLGWHASSYAYNTLDKVSANVEAYKSNGIPLDGIWFDIPYMKNYSQFTVDNGVGGAFEGLSAKIDQWHQAGQKIIPIVEPGFDNTKESPYLADANTHNALLMHENDEDALQMRIWAESNVFLDWFNEYSEELWARGLGDLYEQMNFDGVWLDMNEITGFCNGDISDMGSQCKTTPWPPKPQDLFKPREQEPSKEEKLGFLQSLISNLKTDYNMTWYTSYPSENQTVENTWLLPFIPSEKWNFDNMTISLNASHPATGDRQFDTHSLFGHLESMITNRVLRNATDARLANLKDKRQFLLTRSSYSGTGQWASHWFGDNHRSFDDMRYSIANLFNFNMFGMPHVGADVCGFFQCPKDGPCHSDDEQQEICGRWMQLATFYPFARQHRDLNGPSNEPYNLKPEWQSMAKASIQERYKYLRFMYTCLESAKSEGNTCIDPMFFHYPNDENVYADMESTFMVGDVLKVTPFMDFKKNATTFTGYFPDGNWTDMRDYSTLQVNHDKKPGVHSMLPIPNDTVNVHLKPGGIVHINEDVSDVTKVSDLLGKKYTLVVNRDETGSAKGRVFLDDSDSISDLEYGKYEKYELSLQENSLIRYNLNDNSNSTAAGFVMDKIILANAEDMKDVDFACYQSLDGGIQDLQFAYDADKKTLTLSASGENNLILFNIPWFNFGVKSRDINLCEANAANYYWQDDNKPDLTKASTTGVIQSDLDAVYPKMKVEMAVLKTGALSVHWDFLDKTTLAKTPFEVPKSIVDSKRDEPAESGALSDWVSIGDKGQNLVTIKSGASGVEVFNLQGLILDSYLNKMVNQLKVKGDADFQGVMGLAESVSSELFLKDGIYSLWSHDIPSPVQQAKLPAANLYGSHPFLMAKATDDSWFGLYTNLAAAQDWWISNNKDDGIVSVTTYATGGVGDLYFLFGKDPNEVTKMYHSAIVGHPVLIPQWMLGWNQCRYGYQSDQDLFDSVANYSALGMPLDAQWVDIDFMKNYENFVYDTERFGKLPDLITQLHDNKQYFVPIVDAGFAKRSDYDSYNSGTEQDIWIKAPEKNESAVGQVWPGDAVFPDFFKNETMTWFSDQLDTFWKTIQFDGLWMDMNEVANFCTGSCYDDQKMADSQKYKLRYVPTGRDLNAKSLDIDARHDGGVTELDAHSLFGTMEVEAAHEWFKKENKRTAIIERSAFAGMGKFGSRWLGDNFSTKEMMGYSVTGIMMHNIIGIPLAGSDICGFLGDTTPELCARWHTVGAFYPFSRNHNAINQVFQEPWEPQFNNKTGFYENQITYTDIMVAAVKNKYSMIKYYYTQMSLLSQGQHGAFYKPLFFEFPNDPIAYRDPELNIMLGQGLKLSVLSNELDKNSTDFYFPQGIWCDIMKPYDPCFDQTQGGEIHALGSKAYEFGLHLRDGYIVPYQNATENGAMKTADLNDAPIEFHINARSDGDNWVAAGQYLVDDGESLDVTNKQSLYEITFTKEPTQVGIVFDPKTKATDGFNTTVCGTCINMSEKLRRFTIHNADGIGMDKNYTNIQATGTDGNTRQLTGVADFDVATKQVVFTVDESETVYLPETASIIMQ